MITLVGHQWEVSIQNLTSNKKCKSCEGPVCLAGGKSGSTSTTSRLSLAERKEITSYLEDELLEVGSQATSQGIMFFFCI